MAASAGLHLVNLDGDAELASGPRQSRAPLPRARLRGDLLGPSLSRVNFQPVRTRGSDVYPKKRSRKAFRRERNGESTKTSKTSIVSTPAFNFLCAGGSDVQYRPRLRVVVGLRHRSVGLVRPGGRGALVLVEDLHL